MRDLGPILNPKTPPETLNNPLETGLFTMIFSSRRVLQSMTVLGSEAPILVLSASAFGNGRAWLGIPGLNPLVNFGAYAPKTRLPGIGTAASSTAQ